MRDRIIDEIGKMSGSLIGIGTDDQGMLSAIEENDKIDLCYILSNGKSSNKKKFKLYKPGRNKTVNIRKLSKYFKLKSIDNIVCDYSVVKKNVRFFIGESIYINRGKMFIYGSIKHLNSLEDRYKRYGAKTELIKNNKSFLLIVDNSESEATFFKNAFFRIKDFFSDGIDFITDLLIN